MVEFKSAKVSNAQSQLKDIEEQRKLMNKKAAVSIAAIEKDEEVEEDIGDSSEADSRDLEEEDYESISEDEDVVEESSGEEIIAVEQSGQTEMEDELA